MKILVALLMTLSFNVAMADDSEGEVKTTCTKMYTALTGGKGGEGDLGQVRDGDVVVPTKQGQK
jgi:hypothetical protein